jgi:hypothetical protein
VNVEFERLLAFFTACSDATNRALANFQLNALAFAQPHSLGHTLITEWLTCTHEATDRLSEGSNEPAEMIVIKVFDACSQIEEAYYLDLQPRLKLSVAKADNVKAGLRSIAHKRIIVEVLALRAKIKPQEQ